MSSPTQRALAHARKFGFIAQVVERWNSYAKVRVDLFGVIDVVAIAGDHILGIQATSGANHAARRTKALQEKRLRGWLAAGGRFEIWSYAKRGARGKRKVWELRREPITLENMPVEMDGVQVVLPLAQPGTAA